MGYACYSWVLNVKRMLGHGRLSNDVTEYCIEIPATQKNSLQFERAAAKPVYLTQIRRKCQDDKVSSPETKPGLKRYASFDFYD